MKKIIQENDHSSDGVNLLISILVRFPEIATVSFEPSQALLKLTFMLSGLPYADEVYIQSEQILCDSITAYNALIGHPDIHVRVKREVYDPNLSVLTIVRDVHTLSKGEITLIITLLRERYADQLITDYSDMQEDELLMQEEMIEDMLENMKSHHASHSLIGIREDGRVLVFNK